MKRARNFVKFDDQKVENLILVSVDKNTEKKEKVTERRKKKIFTGKWTIDGHRLR